MGRQHGPAVSLPAPGVLQELQERLFQANMTVTAYRQPAQARDCFASLQAKVQGTYVAAQTGP